MDDTSSVNRKGPHGDGLIYASPWRATAAWPIDDDRGWAQVTAVTALGAAGRRRQDDRARRSAKLRELGDRERPGDGRVHRAAGVDAAGADNVAGIASGSPALAVDVRVRTRPRA